jgi:hypothetical protein
MPMRLDEGWNQVKKSYTQKYLKNFENKFK